MICGGARFVVHASFLLLCACVVNLWLIACSILLSQPSLCHAHVRVCDSLLLNSPFPSLPPSHPLPYAHSPVEVEREGKKREILHDHNDMFILHLSESLRLV